NAATEKAIKMYRNYDGYGSTFGDTSVAATVPNPDELTAFAAERWYDGALTIMVINKALSGATDVQVNLANFTGAGLAQRWQLSAANTITSLSNLPVGGSSFTTTVPAQSITLFVLPVQAGPGQGGAPTEDRLAVVSTLFVDSLKSCPVTVPEGASSSPRFEQPSKSGEGPDRHYISNRVPGGAQVEQNGGSRRTGREQSIAIADLIGYEIVARLG